MRLLQVNQVRGEVEVNQVRGQQVVTQYIISVKHAAYATGNNNNHFLFMINLINYTIYLTKGRELKKNRISFLSNHNEPQQNATQPNISMSR